MVITRNNSTAAFYAVRRLPSAGTGFPPEEIIFGSTPDMATVRRTISKVAETNIPVLITGESGTGKDVIAKFLHAESMLSSRPFVQVNCAAIPATLLESELFGDRKSVV